MPASEAPNAVDIRSAIDADWPAIELLDATCFGVFGPSETFCAWRSSIPAGGSVLACDGDDVVGMAHYLDLRLTVPGGAVLPMAGVTIVAVAPTHRRRGLLRAMYTELHDRIAANGYPLAGLTASEGGIYGRFGYGPATIEEELTVERHVTSFRADAPDPGGVRLVKPTDHRADLEAIYERWRLATPGGIARPRPLWDELLTDRESQRRGGTAWFTFLHPDGYALYRVFGDDPMFVRVAELRAVTRDAHVALSRALVGLDLMKSIRFGTHPADPLPYLLTDSRQARVTHRQDDLWLRIMNIPAALEARAYRAELSTVIEVTDDFRSDGGRFALQIHDGRARCTPTDAAADVRMGQDVLGSLYLGAHRPSAFAAADRLRSNDSEVLAGLDAAFATDVPAELGFGF
ncbi:enhanced intracellular survival protein Eis [Mycobacterium deserti]|uniref:N-acetyltransferase Eis n=1 Tax=Mycobacterium deserti TaxID=2978347 RepID=A0ABT2MHR6_9MYCO|nr:enhanced intracellular survival protein Eis [Mycobacterium deserti]MCT7661829.1 enhanced intracellular survival protein Eis [Mycobacterium deserti]